MKINGCNWYHQSVHRILQFVKKNVAVGKIRSVLSQLFFLSYRMSTTPASPLWPAGPAEISGKHTACPVQWYSSPLPSDASIICYNHTKDTQSETLCRIQNRNETLWWKKWNGTFALYGLMFWMVKMLLLTSTMLYHRPTVMAPRSNPGTDAAFHWSWHVNKIYSLPLIYSTTSLIPGFWNPKAPPFLSVKLVPIPFKA